MFESIQQLIGGTKIDATHRFYSAAEAAATNFGLVLADIIMKSEMRGTISERNREPLNTP